MDQDDIEILGRDRGYDGYVKVDKYHLRHRMHDGGWTGAFDRELVDRGHAAAVLPYDPVRDEVVLIEQFRIGAHVAGHPPWQIEIVAGIIEAGETAEDVARREAVEECGCEIGEMVPICEMLASPGILTETIAIYCGRVDADLAGGIHGVAKENKDIRAFTVPALEAVTWPATGKITNSPTIIALQWLALNRDEVRTRWLSE
jgi:ADP-ribose pyrophosphatase